MPTFLALYGAEPEDFLNGDGSHVQSDAKQLADETHRYVHEHLDNQIDGAAVVTNTDLHERLEAAWNEEPQAVYAVVVHPPDTTSDVVNVYADRETAEDLADQLRSEEQGIAVDVKQYEVEA